ncbi:hypothetical protein L2E82_25976 [Cichorium intybus]|uniref:Uncharacterized protein n=1 Tax=Cichorium intybus TaxID=13427 RepID=A0ACB9E638_CICIN|nr:hypothetical protein L2E82_25976 [Cichorium intybus]
MKSKKLPMIEHKGHKQHKIEHSVDMVDYISNLPDCILHHILSFIPTKEVVKASILSTRWKNLWVSIPNIEIDYALLYARGIDDLNPLKVTSFMNFVEKVLEVRGASKLEKFRLHSNILCDPSKIHLWISHAIMHNVQELDLFLVDAIKSVIPESMFSSMSLTTLKLEIDFIEIPSHVSFPSLKTLHLSFVGFMNDDDVKRLFSGCSVLENLFLEECQWMYLENTVISSSTLKSLTIHDEFYFEEDDDTNGCKIKIDATNLTYFEYIGYLSNEILLINIPSLVKASIHIPLPEERQNEVACRAVNLLKQLSNVVFLRLSSFTLESLRYADKMSDSFPVFSNLSHLMLTEKIGKYTFGALMGFLYFCPILQSICFSEGFKQCMYLGENNPVWLSVPICISNCLKTLTFNKLHAYNSEICFLKCVLKYAHVLEKMDISWSNNQNRVSFLKDKSEVRKELETLKRSSTVCVIKFS